MHLQIIHEETELCLSHVGLSAFDHGVSWTYLCKIICIYLFTAFWLVTSRIWSCFFRKTIDLQLKQKPVILNWRDAFICIAEHQVKIKNLTGPFYLLRSRYLTEEDRRASVRRVLRLQTDTIEAFHTLGPHCEMICHCLFCLLCLGKSRNWEKKFFSVHIPERKDVSTLYPMPRPVFVCLSDMIAVCDIPSSPLQTSPFVQIPNLQLCGPGQSVPP